MSYTATYSRLAESGVPTTLLRLRTTDLPPAVLPLYQQCLTDVNASYVPGTSRAIILSGPVGTCKSAMASRLAWSHGKEAALKWTSTMAMQLGEGVDYGKLDPVLPEVCMLVVDDVTTSGADAKTRTLLTALLLARLDKPVVTVLTTNCEGMASDVCAAVAAYASNGDDELGLKLLSKLEQAVSYGAFVSTAGIPDHRRTT